MLCRAQTAWLEGFSLPQPLCVQVCRVHRTLPSLPDGAALQMPLPDLKPQLPPPLAAARAGAAFFAACAAAASFLACVRAAR